LDTVSIEENPTSAYVSAKFELLTLARSGQSDSPRSAELHETMDKASKAYLFDRKDAEVAFRAQRSELETASREKRQQKKADKKEEMASQAEPSNQSEAEASFSTAEQGPSKEAAADEKAEEDDDETFFGALGATMEEMPTEETTDEGTTVKVRDFKLPKQYSGKSPKSLLEELVRRREKLARPIFTIISKSRAARAKVTIRWENGTVQSFQMDDEACHDQAQAFNYVATMALFALDNASISRQLPPLFRDLWNEIENRKRLQDEASYREYLKELINLVQPRENQFEPVNKSVKEAAYTNGHHVKPAYEANSEVSFALQQDFMERQARPAYLEMLEYRTTLPIASYRGAITNALEAHQILVLCGDTGSGKSTQLPVFILEQELRQGRPVKVYCTQPRRISAISLAQRVSRELGDTPGACGTRHSLVGYNIRLESRVTSTTRLVYATTGIVLRMLEGDRAFDEITHLIIDEMCVRFLLPAKNQSKQRVQPRTLYRIRFLADYPERSVNQATRPQVSQVLVCSDTHER
jgi:ATP-dependent RNA helicase DHX29